MFVKYTDAVESREKNVEYTDFTVNNAYSPVFYSDRLLHSYIVISGSSQLRNAFADTLAAAMLCSEKGNVPCGVCKNCKKAVKGLHPDIIRISPPEGKKEIPVDTVRAVKAESVIMPNEADSKVFIIESADMMNPSAQNALLKILEEPPRHVRFILTAETPSLLLDTVRSRCAEIRLLSEDTETDEEAASAASDFLKAVKGGDLALAQYAYSLEKLDKTIFPAFIREVKKLAVGQLKSGKLSPSELFRITSAMDDAAVYLKLNVNPVHISGMLCAKLLHEPNMPTK